MTNYILSPALKLVFIAVLAGIWKFFVFQWIQPFLYAAQWFFSMSLYKHVPQEALQFMWEVIVFWSSYKIFLWVVMPGAHDVDQISGDRASSQVQNKSGFTTRSIYS